MSEIVLKDLQGRVIDKLYQWDSHVTLSISGFPVDPLPTLHFAHQCSDTSIAVIPSVSGDKLVATIPDVLLREDSPITVYFYVPLEEDDETGYRTIEDITLTVIGRQEPGDYSTTDMEILSIDIDANGDYYPGIQQAFGEVHVNLIGGYNPTSDVGKVVDSQGHVVSQSSLSIIADGTYDTTENNEVVVDTPNEYALSDVDIKTTNANQSYQNVWDTSKTILYEGFTVSYDATTSNSTKSQWNTQQNILYTGESSVSDGVVKNHVYRYTGSAWEDLGNALTQYHVYQYQTTPTTGWVDLGPSDVGKIVYRDTDSDTTYLKSQIDGSSSPITHNGKYNTSEMSTIVVDVFQGDVSAADNGKVVVNGELVSQETLSVTTNGTYDTTSKNVVSVNVARSSLPCTVKFEANGTTLETVSVAYGGTATYTGTTPTYTPDPTNYVFSSWLPEPVNVTGDITCVAQFRPVGATEITDEWSVISGRAVAGDAQQYYQIGDYKKVNVVGKVGDIGVNCVMNAVIIDFDHDPPGTGVHGINFGLFSVGSGTNIDDVCMIDGYYETSDDTGSLIFNINHNCTGSSAWSYGGWAGCDLRYDILGSTNKAPLGYGESPDIDRRGRDGYSGATTNPAANPVPNSLMSCLPSDLRAVIRPMYIQSNNAGGGNSSAVVGQTTDYLPLLSAYEIFGSVGTGLPAEADAQTQYAYFENNAHVRRKRNIDTSRYASYWTRTPSLSASSAFAYSNDQGVLSVDNCNWSNGLLPMFFV